MRLRAHAPSQVLLKFLNDLNNAWYSDTNFNLTLGLLVQAPAQISGHEHEVASSKFFLSIIDWGIYNCAVCYGINLYTKKPSKATRSFMPTPGHPPPPQKSHEVWEWVDYSVHRHFYSIPKWFRVSWNDMTSNIISFDGTKMTTNFKIQAFYSAAKIQSWSYFQMLWLNFLKLDLLACYGPPNLCVSFKRKSKQGENHWKGSRYYTW